MWRLGGFWKDIRNHPRASMNRVVSTTVNNHTALNSKVLTLRYLFANWKKYTSLSPDQKTCIPSGDLRLRILRNFPEFADFGWQDDTVNFPILQNRYLPSLYHSFCLLFYTDTLCFLNMIPSIFVLVLLTPCGPKDRPIHKHGIPPRITGPRDSMHSEWGRGRSP